MTPIEVLKMLKFKIETAEQNNHNYVIETSDREVIEQTVLSYGTKSCSTCKHYLDDSDAFEAKIITEENKRLHFMIENGVGFEDMIGWPNKSNNLPYQLDDVYNISNNAQCMYDGQKSKATVSLNEPWLEAIKNLCQQTARLMIENRNLKQLQTPTPSVTENIYEYEMYFDSEPGESIQIQGWYPIETDRIIHKDRIPKYIESGLLRKINNK